MLESAVDAAQAGEHKLALALKAEAAVIGCSFLAACADLLQATGGPAYEDIPTHLSLMVDMPFSKRFSPVHTRRLTRPMPQSDTPFRPRSLRGILTAGAVQKIDLWLRTFEKKKALNMCTGGPSHRK